MTFGKLISWACVAILSGCAVDTGSSQPESLAEADSALCKNALSASQEQITLRLIDNICGDTWCDGDYDFAFNTLDCTPPHGTHSGSCTLKLHIIPREGVPSPRASYARSCTTPNFTNFDSLVATAPNGYQSLQPTYYDALTECMFDLEAALPR